MSNGIHDGVSKLWVMNRDHGLDLSGFKTELEAIDHLVRVALVKKVSPETVRAAVEHALKHLDDTRADLVETGTRTPLGVDRVAVFDAWAAELRERRPSPEPNNSPFATEFAQRGPAPWALACVRALESETAWQSRELSNGEIIRLCRLCNGVDPSTDGGGHSGCPAAAALSLVPADVLAAAREERP